MRILFIIASSNFGGTENFLLNLIKGLTSAGITVGIVCPNNGIFKEELGNIYYVDMKKEGYFSSLKSILKVTKEFKPSIIHTHLSRASSVGLFFQAMYKIPVVATVHNVLGGCQLSRVHLKYGLSKNANYVYKLLTVFGGKLIAVSEYIKDALIADKVDPNKVKVIINGTHFADMPVPPKSTFLRNKYNIAEKDIIIGIVGGVRKGKGQILAVEAIGLMLEEVRNSVKLVMIGNYKEDNYKKSIDDFVMQNNLQDNVIFAGVYTNMSEIYADIDIFLHPSYSEACSMAIIEAMSTAKPVVVSNIPANTYIVDDNINGCLVELNPPDIETKLSKLVLDSELRLSLSANARSKAESNFSLNKMTTDYIDFYNNVCNQ